MDSAGHEVHLRPGQVHREPSEVIDNLERAYLSDVDGDPRLALRQAIADWVEAATFVRWGRPTTPVERSR